MEEEFLTKKIAFQRVSYTRESEAYNQPKYASSISFLAIFIGS